MSLVGPRPVTPEELTRYGRHARHYLRFRPGLTGAWQVSGVRSYCQRVLIDVHYARRWSLRRDFAILMRTPLAILRSERPRLSPVTGAPTTCNAAT
jgi:exopolysaccharide production protein ExoY